MAENMEQIRKNQDPNERVNGVNLKTILNNKFLNYSYGNTTNSNNTNSIPMFTSEKPVVDKFAQQDNFSSEKVVKLDFKKVNKVSGNNIRSFQPNTTDYALMEAKVGDVLASGQKIAENILIQV